MDDHNIGLTCEDVYIQENKDAVLSDMEEYFPNGGQDYDNITELLDVIVEGKIPLIGLKY